MKLKTPAYFKLDSYYTYYELQVSIYSIYFQCFRAKINSFSYEINPLLNMNNHDLKNDPKTKTNILII